VHVLVRDRAVRNKALACRRQDADVALFGAAVQEAVAAYCQLARAEAGVVVGEVTVVARLAAVEATIAAVGEIVAATAAAAPDGERSGESPRGGWRTVGARSS
jgi:hypothetical protein